jgi:hypothetical protein
MGYFRGYGAGLDLCFQELAKKKVQTFESLES